MEFIPIGSNNGNLTTYGIGDIVDYNNSCLCNIRSMNLYGDYGRLNISSETGICYTRSDQSAGFCSCLDGYSLEICKNYNQGTVVSPYHIRTICLSDDGHENASAFLTKDGISLNHAISGSMGKCVRLTSNAELIMCDCFNNNIVTCILSTNIETPYILTHSIESNSSFSCLCMNIPTYFNCTGCFQQELTAEHAKFNNGIDVNNNKITQLYTDVTPDDFDAVNSCHLKKCIADRLSTASLCDTTIDTNSLWTSQKINDCINSALSGLSWQSPVLDFVANTNATPTDNGRYIVRNDNNIYSYNDSTWNLVHTTSDNDTVWVENLGKNYTYNSDNGWVLIGTTINHENLTGLLGGNNNEHYHFTETEHNTLVNGGDATTLHEHDSRYYVKTEIDNYNNTFYTLDGSRCLTGSAIQFSSGTCLLNTTVDTNGKVIANQVSFTSESGLSSTDVNHAIDEVNNKVNFTSVTENNLAIFGNSNNIVDSGISKSNLFLADGTVLLTGSAIQFSSGTCLLNTTVDTNGKVIADQVSFTSSSGLASTDVNTAIDEVNNKVNFTSVTENNIAVFGNSNNIVDSGISKSNLFLANGTVNATGDFIMCGHNIDMCGGSICNVGTDTITFVDGNVIKSTAFNSNGEIVEALHAANSNALNGLPASSYMKDSRISYGTQLPTSGNEGDIFFLLS